MTPRPPAPPPLPAPVADSHCHLDHAAGGGQPLPVGEALAAAAAVGVTRVVQVGCDPAGARWAADCARTHAGVVAAVGIHPNEAPRMSEAAYAAELAAVEVLLASDRVRGVGETGLDFYRTGPEGRARQEDSFRAHIALARQHDKALVIHDRDAHDDVLRVLAAEPLPGRVVFHCFSGDAAMARHCVERGWFLSFAGTVTFKNAAALREALTVVPGEQLLVETDAPYLTPSPHRGRPNASYLVPLTVRAMAAVRGEDEDALCAALDAATTRAFGSWESVGASPGLA